MEKTKSDGLVLFVRAKPGHIVRRFGTSQNIGAMADGKGNVIFDGETIHALSNTEVARYQREYDDSINVEKSLDKCTREEWEKQRTAKRDAAKKAAEKAEHAAQKHNDKPSASEPGKGG